MSDELAAWAIAYTGLRWPVLPLWWPADGRCACPRGERCSSPGKHPLTVHGLEDATTDAELIDTWWQRWPQANIGLRTGIVFDALDLDGPGAGNELARRAHTAGEDTAECWGWGPMVATSKGWHLFYAPTGAGNRAGLVPGADWRGAGGYVVASPSAHVSGHVYAWHEDCGPWSPIPEAPKILVDLVTRRHDQPVAARTPGPAAPGRQGWSPAGLVSQVATAAEGGRNDALNWSVFRVASDLAAGRCERDQANDAISQLTTAAARAGLDAREIEATIRSALGSTTGR